MSQNGSRSRKVLIISNTSWYLWNFRLNLMLLLQREGCEVIAVAPADAYSERFASHGIRFVPVGLNRRGRNPLAELTSVAALWRIFRREAPGVILTYTPKPNIYGSFAAMLCRIPIVNNVAGLGYVFMRKGLLQQGVKLLYRLAFCRSRKVFFQNNEDMGIFVNGGMVSQAVAERLPGSGVDTERFRPAAGGETAPSFLLVARLLWDKGIGEFVEAARLVRKTHPEATFRLLGPFDEGNPAAISKAQVDEWLAEGIIEYLGATDSVAEYLAVAGAAVLPSYREGVPRSLLEAASMARPVITTDAPGCRDVVDDGVSGYLCAVKDAADLAAKMAAFLSLEEEERREMGRQGRQKMVRQFSETIVLDRYAQLVAETLDPEGEAPRVATGAAPLHSARAAGVAGMAAVPLK